MLPQFITASTWLTVFNSIYGSASLLGQREADGLNKVPRLTNREAIALIQGWREVAPLAKDGWPLWAQFAAIAYGVSPDNDAPITTSEQGDKIYDVDMGLELWTQLKDLAQRIDQERPGAPPPRIDLTGETFDDVTFQGDLKRSMEEDGFTGQGPITDFFDAVKDNTKDALKKVSDRVVGPVIRTVQLQKLIIYAALILAAAYALGNTMEPNKRRRRR